MKAALRTVSESAHGGAEAAFEEVLERVGVPEAAEGRNGGDRRLGCFEKSGYFSKLGFGNECADGLRLRLAEAEVEKGPRNAEVLRHLAGRYAVRRMGGDIVLRLGDHVLRGRLVGGRAAEHHPLHAENQAPRTLRMDAAHQRVEEFRGGFALGEEVRFD